MEIVFSNCVSGRGFGIFIIDNGVVICCPWVFVSFFSTEYIAFMICFGISCTNELCSSFMSQMNYFMQNMSIEKRVETPKCNIVKVVHNK